jgi:serine acetyltransferase
VVHKHALIGENCTLRHSTTIGNAKEGGNCPVIGDNVEIGAHVCIIGDITIGNNVVIGSGSVVVASIPSNSLAVGNPARVIKSTASSEPRLI